MINSALDLMRDSAVIREHGGNVYQASAETGIPLDRIIDFSASINPLGVPETVVQVIREGIKYLPHYPEPFAEQLTMQLGRHLDIDPGMILCGNGSTELIYLVVRALAPRKVLIPAPTFSEYERACNVQRGTTCVPYVLSPEDNFDLDVNRFISAMEGCDMAFLCNPNNPTGRLLTRDAVITLADAAERLNCYLVVDEAFIDFTNEPGMVRDVMNYSHLIVLRSLTKFYALSGLRIGYGVFPASLMGLMKKHKEPWTINLLAQQAGIAAINDTVYQRKTISSIAEGKRFVEQGLSTLGIEYLPSAVNYYLLRSGQAQEIVESFRKKGILVRSCSNFAGLDDSYLRIAVRSLEDNAVLLKELARTCAA